MRRTFLLLAAVVLSASSALGQAKEGKGSEVRAAIEAANKQFIEAFNKGDAAAVAAMYSADARLLPPNSPMGEGRQAVQQELRILSLTGGLIR